MSDKLIKQHNAITTAQYEMTALEKNIFYMLLMQLDDRKPSKTRYSISVKDLEVKIEKQIDHVQFKRAVDKLVNRILFTRQEAGYLKLNILSSGEYRGGKVELELSKEIKYFLFALKRNFTTFRLAMALNLRSKYSKRMYEMLSQFKDTGMMRVTVEELKKRLVLFDLATGKERYTEFGLFKKYALDVAQRELAEQTDIRFTYTAQKTGKKYTDLAFNISYIPFPQDSTQPNVSTCLPPKVDSSKVKQSKYPHPDLEGDTLKQYLMLTKELRWLDKKQAYKVVTSVPARHLWNYIDKLGFEIRAGKGSTKPADFFKALLARRDKKLQPIQVNKADNKQATIPDAETAMRGSCYKKLVLDFGLDILLVSRIATQIAPDKLKNFLDKIPEEMQHKGISEGAKGNYLLKRLKQEYHMSL